MKNTEKSTEIYEYIKNYILKNMYPPSIREIGRAVGLKSTASTYYHILKLEKNGLITVSDGRISLVGYKIVKDEN